MKYLIYSLSIVVMMASCKKLEDVQSKEDQLRQGKWKLTAVSNTYKNPITGKDSVLDGTPYIADCQKDNYLVFSDNYEGYSASGKDKCQDGEADQLSFNWGLEDNDTRMYIYNATDAFGTSSVNAKLSNFSSSSFTLKFDIYIPYQDPTHPTITLTDTAHVTTTYQKF